MIDRRTMLTAALAAHCGPLARPAARLPQAGMSRITAYAFSFPGAGRRRYQACRLSPASRFWSSIPPRSAATRRNMPGLQELWTEFHGRGLMIIGVPSNDFGGQEPGGATEIAETAQHQYGVTFPIAAKAVVKGAERASVLQMGGRGAAKGCSALELPQIPDRPRRLYRRGLSGIGRALRYAGQNRHRAGAGGILTPPQLTGPADKSALWIDSRCRGERRSN